LLLNDSDVRLGQKQTCATQNGMSALPLKATTKADISSQIALLGLGLAMCGLTMHHA